MTTLTQVEQIEEELIQLNEEYSETKSKLRDLYHTICDKQKIIMDYFDITFADEKQKQVFVQNHIEILQNMHQELYPELKDDDLPDKYDNWIDETSLSKLKILICNHTKK